MAVPPAQPPPYFLYRCPMLRAYKWHRITGNWRMCLYFCWNSQHMFRHRRTDIKTGSNDLDVCMMLWRTTSAFRCFFPDSSYPSHSFSSPLNRWHHKVNNNLFHRWRRIKKQKQKSDKKAYSTNNDLNEC